MSDLASNHSLQAWQQKIQEKRRMTFFRDFVRECASRFNVIIQRTDKGIGRYPKDGRFKSVISRNEFENCTPLTMEINSSKSFFMQVEELFINAPKTQSLSIGENENSLYTESSFGVKNAYLCIEVGIASENVLYSTIVYFNCTNIFNSLQVTFNCNNVYTCKSTINSFNIFYSKFILDSNNIWFSSNLQGCEECILCDDLQNQKYYIQNTPYTKEEYFQRKNILLKELLIFADAHYTKVSNIGKVISSEECTGSGVFLCDHIENGNNIARIHNGRNVFFADGGDAGCSNFFDTFHSGDTSTDFYAVSCCGIRNIGIYCSVRVVESTNIFYSYHIDSCSFCLGCIGLKNKSYCILNKQYSKEERYEKVDEIFSQMENDGTLGQFFPGSMCPFYFNDTAAYLIMGSEGNEPSSTAGQAFTKEEVTAKGYLWRDEPIKVDIPEGAKVVKTSDLDQYEGWHDNQRRIDPEILNVIIQDEAGNVYRIVKMEYDFLLKHGLPLPRKHRLDRMKENFRIQ